MRTLARRLAARRNPGLKAVHPIHAHPHRYMFGECFFELTKDQADEKLEAQKTEKEAEIDVLKGELKTIQGRLSDLKSSLYGVPRSRRELALLPRRASPRPAN